MTYTHSSSDQLELYRLMYQIRATEEFIADKYSEQEMRCPVHLSIGQEGVAAGVSLHLKSSDLAVSGHRAHAHYLAKGGSVKKMLAEIYGKKTGCSGGKGGSMHLIDESVGFKGSTAIVGGTIPVGVGLGFSIKHYGTKDVAVIYLGDGAVEEGAFYESVNFAVLKKLPVLFVCENNFYSVYSHLKVRQPEGREIFKMVAAMGIDTQKADGNDVEEVSSITHDLISKIRAGLGPQFIEFTTYRWREHCGPNFDNHIGYRSEEEYQQWKAQDPVATYKSKLLQSNSEIEQHLKDIEENVHSEISAAYEFAKSSPFPSSEDLMTNVFFEGNTNG